MTLSAAECGNSLPYVQGTESSMTAAVDKQPGEVMLSQVREVANAMQRSSAGKLSAPHLHVADTFKVSVAHSHLCFCA